MPRRELKITGILDKIGKYKLNWIKMVQFLMFMMMLMMMMMMIVLFTLTLATCFSSFYIR